MLLHFRLYATMALIGGAILFCGNIAIAEWTEPVCLAELNDHENGFTGHQPCIAELQQSLAALEGNDTDRQGPKRDRPGRGPQGPKKLMPKK